MHLIILIVALLFCGSAVANCEDRKFSSAKLGENDRQDVPCLSDIPGMTFTPGRFSEPGGVFDDRRENRDRNERGPGTDRDGGNFTGTRADNNNTPNENVCPTPNPVVISSGNKIKTEYDFGTPGEMPIELFRSYNLKENATGLFGRNWTSSFDHKLVITDRDVTLHRPNASTYKFRLNRTTNRWEDSKPESISSLIKNSDGTWTLEHERETIEQFSSVGRVLSIHNRKGIGLTFTYAGSQLTSVQHTSGRRVTITWASGKVVSVTDPAGNVYNYSYNAAGYLAEVRYPNNAGKRTYHYEDANGANRLTGISVDSVRHTQYGYHADGRVAYSGLVGGVEKLTFSYGTNQTTVTNSLGGVETYTYVDVNGIKKLSSLNRAGTSSCPSASRASTYDSITGALRTETDWKGNQTEYSYDRRGRLLTTFTAGRTKVLYWNDATNELVKEEFWDGRPPFGKCPPDQMCKTLPPGGTLRLTMEYAFYPSADPAAYRLKSVRAIDNQSGAVRESTYSYAFHANKVLATKTIDGPLAGNGDLIVERFDTAGNLLSVTNSFGHTVSYGGYNAMGLAAYRVDANGLQTDYGYDERYRPKTITVRASEGWYTTTTLWNGFGKIAKITSPSGAYVTFEYDAAGRLTKKKLPPGEVFNDGDEQVTVNDDYIEYVYNTLSLVTNQRTKHQHTTRRYDEDLRRWLVNTTFTTYHEQSAGYDALGNQSAAYGANGQRLTYTYDANQNIETITDALGRISRYTYNEDNKPATLTDAAGGVIRWQYDNQGRLNAVTDARGNSTRYYYNGFGDVIRQESPDSGVTLYSYNAGGQLDIMTRNDGSMVQYAYDALGRLDYISAGSSWADYQYDNCSYGIGRLCAVLDQTGSLSYAYSNSGKLLRQVNVIQAPLSRLSRTIVSADSPRQRLSTVSAFATPTMLSTALVRLMRWLPAFGRV